MAEDAVRSETVSRADLPAICDLQGDFQELQRERSYFLANFLMFLRCCKDSPDLRSREHFLDIAGKSSVNCEWGQGWRARASRANAGGQIRRDRAGLEICNQQIVTAAASRSSAASRRNWIAKLTLRAICDRVSCVGINVSRLVVKATCRSAL